jgi:ribulose-phosphate 3-epimerase
MPVICPAILAHDEKQYREQIEKIVHLAHRIQIDLSDGIFSRPKTITPEQTWWPAGFKADIHLMYKDPLSVLKAILPHKPHLIIIHAESDGDFNQLADMCKKNSVKVGVALLAETPADSIASALSLIDHVLIFSGNLGEYGGQANLGLLSKVEYLKSRKLELEIGWDGGVKDQNIAQLINGGVEVLNVGGYIQKASDPARAFSTLQRIADETGTT